MLSREPAYGAVLDRAILSQLNLPRIESLTSRCRRSRREAFVPDRRAPVRAVAPMKPASSRIRTGPRVQTGNPSAREAWYACTLKMAIDSNWPSISRQCELLRATCPTICKSSLASRIRTGTCVATSPVGPFVTRATKSNCCMKLAMTLGLRRENVPECTCAFTFYFLLFT